MISRMSLTSFAVVLVVLLGLSVLLSGCPWWNGFWTSATAIILTVTLAAIVKYTDETAKMAEATRGLARSNETMASIQTEEIGLRKRPVISIVTGSRTTLQPAGVFATPDPDKYDLYPVVRNLSNVHAKLQIRVSIRLKGEWHEIPATSYYGGKTWNLQAGTEFPGRLNWPADLGKMTELSTDAAARTMSGALIQLRCRSMNFFELRAWPIEDPEIENPTLYWSWNGKRWIAQPAVDLEGIDVDAES